MTALEEQPAHDDEYDNTYRCLLLHPRVEKASLERAWTFLGSERKK